MADLSNYPNKYLLYNQQLSKNLIIVMEVEGLPFIYGIARTYTTVKYGDPGIVYGLPGLVYGGLRVVDNIKPWIILDGSLTIGQKIEPEQGKGNIGTLTMTLIDFNGEVSRVIAPGVVVDEIIAKREVKIWLGYKDSSFPEDYLLVYRGYVTSIQCPPGLVRFQISDSTSKKRQPLYNAPTTLLSSGIDDSTGTIPVDSTVFFYSQILGPTGFYDSSVRTFIQIDDEIMEYGPGDLGVGVINVTRGALGTVAAPHDADASVSNGVLLGDESQGTNALEIMLKTLLSGWNGPCETDIPVVSFYNTSVGPITNGIQLGNDAKGKPYDALKDLGLIVGDYITITGATDPGNDFTGTIVGIQDGLTPNNILLVSQDVNLEPASSAVAAFRSQYDTYPTDCGIKLRMRDVDLDTILYIKRTYFSAGISNMRFYQNNPIQGKDFVDSQILFPLGCYGISRFGRVSMSVTKPPLPGIGKLIQLDWTNVIDPDKINVTRATNNRGFYNLVSFEYNKIPATGDFTSIRQFLDTDSLNLFDQTSKLPIQAPGITDSIGAPIAQQRGRALLTRYKNCVITIELSVNWSAGSLIEVSDVVILRDDGRLKIMNFETGERNIGTQLYEVIDRQYNIMDGNVKLKLLGGLGFSLDSRFALYSPSSQLNSGSTAEILRLKPSYGQTSITGEMAKWIPLIGMQIQVHSYDWTYNEVTTILGLSLLDPTALMVSPALSGAPPEDYIIDIVPYSSSTDKNVDSLYKTLYAHFSPTVAIVAGLSATQFEVDPGDVSKFFVKAILVVHNEDWTDFSPEVKVTDITGNIITVTPGLGFTPTSSHVVDGIGFADAQSFYRWG